MTIKTALYDTENVWNLLEKDLISGIERKNCNQMKTIRIFQIKDGGGLLWSKSSAKYLMRGCYK